MVDNKKTGYTNPEIQNSIKQTIQDQHNLLFDSELAKHQEELKNLEAELEESKLAKGKVPEKLTKNIDSEKDLNQADNQLVSHDLDENVSATGEHAAAEDDPDDRSVFVKNVDFSADDQQLIEHFKECGEIVRVTIRKDKHTNQPLGLAYIEFANKESSIKAKHLNESLFKGRQLTVLPKRKNLPGHKSARGGFNPRGANPIAMMMALMRGMGGRGRGGFRGRGFRGGRGRGGDSSQSGVGEQK